MFPDSGKVRKLGQTKKEREMDKIKFENETGPKPIVMEQKGRREWYVYVTPESGKKRLTIGEGTSKEGAVRDAKRRGEWSRHFHETRPIITRRMQGGMRG